LVGSLVGLTLLVVAVGVGFMVGTLDRPSNVFGFRGGTLMLTLAFAAIGAVLASRRPGNPIGWIFLIVGVASGVQFLAKEYAVFSQARGDRLGAAIGDWIDSWIWVPIVGSVAIHVFLLFPTGRPPSPRWRWVLWTGTAAIVVFAAAFAVGSETELGLKNPFFDVSEAVTGPALGVGAGVFLGSLIAAAASLVLRFRRSRGDEREQLKWFAAAASLVALFLVAAIFSGLVIPGRPLFDRMAEIGTMVSFMSIPVATGVAVLKYHLYDLDVVITRAVLYGALVATITLIYLGIVVGVGALLGRRGGLVLPGVAAAVVALLFQPLRARARRLADRVVYGNRATPYEILAEFSDRVAGTYAAEDVLPRMARILGEGTAAARAEVWLRVGGELRRAATWPGPQPWAAVSAPHGDAFELPGMHRAVPVRHHGDLLGALALSKPRGESVNPAEDRLMTHLAAQAGLVLRNVGLIEELRASRQRLVAAQDEERRRIERNLHDGAQQQLVALSVKLRLAETMARKNADRGADLMAEARADTQEALDTLRDLARGIYPPLLADKGLPTALEAQARKSAVPVTIEPNGVGRFPPEVEATVYFCVLEALQNVNKYADAAAVVVQLEDDDDRLVFRVSDDGRGFDPSTTRRGTGLQNMADRVDAHGGEIEVRSAPGEGTTVTGRVPVVSRSASGQRRSSQEP
jgi:signal transduction histidine kinase